MGNFPQEGFGESSQTIKTVGVPLPQGKERRLTERWYALALPLFLCLRVILFLFYNAIITPNHFLDICDLHKKSYRIKQAANS